MCLGYRQTLGTSGSSSVGIARRRAPRNFGRGSDAPSAGHRHADDDDHGRKRALLDLLPVQCGFGGTNQATFGFFAVAMVAEVLTAGAARAPGQILPPRRSPISRRYRSRQCRGDERRRSPHARTPARATAAAKVRAGAAAMVGARGAARPAGAACSKPTQPCLPARGSRRRRRRRLNGSAPSTAGASLLPRYHAAAAGSPTPGVAGRAGRRGAVAAGPAATGRMRARHRQPRAARACGR